MLLIERFDPASALEAIAAARASRDHGRARRCGRAWASHARRAPPTRSLGARRPRRARPSSPPEVGERCSDRFGLELTEGYGLTEASPVVTTSDRRSTRSPGSIGVPLPGIEVRLVDADGEDALVGDAGEIWVRGPERVPGLLERSRGHRSALTDDGWLRTGDIAVVDDDGYLYLVDRAKDLIIVSGFNVFPAEVEEVLLEHPARRGGRGGRRAPPAHRRGGEGLRRACSPGRRSRRTT